MTPPAPPVPTFQSTGSEMVAFDGYVYFAANDGVVGNELWRTDGTPAGTTLVKDFNVGNAASSGNPRQLTVVGTRMFLIATTTASPYAVFTIDQGGTPQATSVTGGVAGSQATGGTLMGAVDGKALLNHYDGSTNKLYSLGASGSVFAADHRRQQQRRRDRRPRPWAAGPTTGRPPGNNSATEPWRTNGTTAAAGQGDRPGINGSGPSDFIATGNRAYFTADDGVHGRELWVTDGTDGGTQIVHEHHPLNVGTSISTGRPTATSSTTCPTIRPPVRRSGARKAPTPRRGWSRTSRRARAGSGQIQLFPFKDGFGMLRGSDVYASDGTDAGTTLLNTVDGDGYGPALPDGGGIEVLLPWRILPLRERRLALGRHPAGTFALTAGAFDGGPPGLPVRRSLRRSWATRSSSPRSTRTPSATPSPAARAGSTSSTPARPTRPAGPRPRRRSPARRRSGRS